MSRNQSIRRWTTEKKEKNLPDGTCWRLAIINGMAGDIVDALGSIRNENESQRRNVSNACLDGIHLAQNNKRAKHIAINWHFVLWLCDANAILLFMVRRPPRDERKKNETKRNHWIFSIRLYPFTQFYSWLNGISLNRKAWINVQAHGKCVWFISVDVHNPSHWTENTLFNFSNPNTPNRNEHI